MIQASPESRALSLKGSHAIVTGGGRGLGRTIATELAAAGADVTVMGRDTSDLHSCASELSDRFGVRSHAASCDVSREDSVTAAFAETASAMGSAHILVNNAGQASSTPFVDISREMWRHTLDVNLTGAFLCTQKVLAPMIAAGRGRIVNIASTAALRGYSHLAAYCASKHGMLGMTRALALEVARSGITVNAVCPGYTEGGMSDQAISAIMTLRSVSAEEAMTMLTRNNPLRRLTTQEEVAATVVWLCSPDSSAITGQAIAVAGGEVM
jgi:NAD(P)-dependent dehydrogenase (short-subunit alcohol dehydrogenase family)